MKVAKKRNRVRTDSGGYSWSIYRSVVDTPLHIARILMLCVLKRVSLWGIYRKKGLGLFWRKIKKQY